ncbi:MAG: penicillin acylase family protein [Promethearchaeota archaeon]
MKQGITAGISTLFIIFLSYPLFNIFTPVGEIIEPVGGLYDHADDGVFPDVERVVDASLKGEVTVYRDQYGTPHIYAEYLDDAYFALGYVMALDRLWEMDLFRRLGEGRLAEVFYPKASFIDFDPNIIVLIDEYMRLMGLKEGAQRIIDKIYEAGTDSVQYRMSSRFINGTNHVINKLINDGNLPLEFSLLNYEPEPWTELDTAVIGLIIAYMLSLSTKDLDYTSLALTLGEYIENNIVVYANRGFDKLFPDTNGSLPYECPVIPNNNTLFASSNEQTQPEKMIFVSALKSISNLIQTINRYLGIPMEDGVVPASNNWVAGGNRTLNKMPILCSDPHLIIMQPAIFYEVHIVFNNPVKMNCHGVTFPGLPVILIGFNDHIAWGITSFGSDSSVDYYYETLNDDGTKYFFNGSWRDVEFQREIIHVRNGPDQEFIIRKTHHGPIISDLASVYETFKSAAENAGIEISDAADLRSIETPDISMSWVGNWESNRDILFCIFQINVARNISEFETALRNWTAPPQNVVFADIDGNIGMYIPGLHPIRAIGKDIDPLKYTGSFIQPGNGSGQEWVGFIPFENIPKARNPSQGYLASANQRSIKYDDYNYSVGHAWGVNYRGRRINQLLNSSWNITRETMIAYQADIHDLAAERFVPALLSALSSETLSGDYLLGYQELLAWNNSFNAFEMQKEMVAPIIFELFLRELQKATWSDEYKVSGATGLSYPSLQYLEYMVREDPASPWFDNVQTPDTNETRDDIMRLAYYSAMDIISSERGNLSANRNEWLWGRNHKLLPLSILNIYELFVKKNEDAAVPYDGSARCLRNAPGFPIGGFTMIVAGGPSWRHIVDFSRIDEPLTVLPVGNSGSMFSTHWDDQLNLYINNQYKKPCRANTPEEYRAESIVESSVLFTNGSR